MNILIGYTGFVGSNLYNAGKFDRCFNSINIQEAYGLMPELLIFAGLRAEKYLANQFPEKDMALIYEAEDNIKKINPKKLVLISTIDVYKNPIGVNEESEITDEGLTPYGFNRYQLELWVRKNYPDALIIRLPGLYGINIKKNFIYDFINIIPFKLKEDKMLELMEKEPLLKEYYVIQDNGFYECKELQIEERKKLKEVFKTIGFNALNFTDSRSIYQFYPLSHLWHDIQIAIKNDLKLWNPATEPILVSELYEYLTGKRFINELKGIPAAYDYTTNYSKFFGEEEKYILNKYFILADIEKFIDMNCKEKII